MVPLFLSLWLPLQAVDAARLVAEGIHAYDAMELELAYEKLSTARRDGGPEERARAELWLGVVELERGRDAAARRHFRAALQADPRLEVPARLSPKVRALVEELRPAAPPPKPRPRGSARPRSPAPNLRYATMPPPEGAVEAIDEATSGADAASEQPTAPDVGAEQRPVATAPRAVSPFLVVAASCGALAATGLASALALGVSAKVLEGRAQEAPRAADATEAYQQAAGNALLANVLFGASAAAAIAGGAGVALWAWDGGAE